MTDSEKLKNVENSLQSCISFFSDCEKGIRSDSQLICDAINSGMIESLQESLENIKSLQKK